MEKQQSRFLDIARRVAETLFIGPFVAAPVLLAVGLEGIGRLFYAAITYTGKGINWAYHRTGNLISSLLPSGSFKTAFDRVRKKIADTVAGGWHQLHDYTIRKSQAIVNWLQDKSPQKALGVSVGLN